jgi:hypothetical protein
MPQAIPLVIASWKKSFAGISRDQLQSCRRTYFQRSAAGNLLSYPNRTTSRSLSSTLARCPECETLVEVEASRRSTGGWAWGNEAAAPPFSYADRGGGVESAPLRIYDAVQVE